MKRYWLLLISLFAVLALSLSGCGGGGGGGGGVGGPGDSDGDGIPNTDDAFPNDAARFANFTSVNLAGLQGATFGSAAAINDAGLIVGTSNDVQGDVHAVAWSVSGTTPSSPLHLEAPAHAAGIPEFAAAFGVNNGGDAVGEANNSAGGRDAVFWVGSAGSPAAASPTVCPPIAGALFSAAYDINESRRIVGESQSGSVNKAVTWAVNAAGVPGQPTLLGEPTGATASTAFFIDEANRVVGEYTTSTGEVHGIMWTLDASGAVTGMVDLPPLAGSTASAAYAINDAGRIVGESSSAAGVKATTWTVSGSTVTSAPLGTVAESNVLNIDDGGRIIGWTAPTAGGAAMASIMDARNLNIFDSVVAASAGSSMGFGINNNGVVVGMVGNGAFVAVPQ